MKIYNIKGDILTLTKTTLKLKVTCDPGGDNVLGLYPCTNVLKLADLKRALILSKKYDAWVPVSTKYTNEVAPRTIFHKVSRTGREIGCQTFDPANWRKIISALSKVKSTSLKVARTW